VWHNNWKDTFTKVYALKGRWRDWFRNKFSTEEKYISSYFWLFKVQFFQDVYPKYFYVTK